MARIIRVILVALLLLLILAIALCALACYHYRCGPFYALALWSCMYGFSPFLVFPVVLGTLLVAGLVCVRFLPRRLQTPIVFLTGCLALTGLLINHLHYPKYDEFTPSREELDEVRQWFWENPPDEKNRSERRKRMAVLQKACDQLRPEVFYEYANTWYPREWMVSHGYEWLLAEVTHSSEDLEAEHPALYYLRCASAHAMEDIRRARVRKGVAVWAIYNMGYVFKTPEACFGIDVTVREAERLARDLDFLLITHRHADHFFELLESQLIKDGKAVLAQHEDRDSPGCTTVAQPGEFHFGTIRVKADIGDHGFHRRKDEVNNVLMFQVDCGESGNSCTIYHTGDAGIVSKMRPDNEVDVLIIHNGLPVKQAVCRLNPRMTLVSHVMELGHRPKLFPRFGRAPFDFAYRWSLRGLPPEKGTVLTWGERWLLPGTILEGDDDK